MQNTSQKTTAIMQLQDVPSFPDDLEAIIATIECRLLETLTPRQFSLVEHLVEATRLLTEAELTLAQCRAGELMSA
jgi:hypothetical protein